jgi:hypothetical protein
MLSLRVQKRVLLLAIKFKIDALNLLFGCGMRAAYVCLRPFPACLDIPTQGPEMAAYSRQIEGLIRRPRAESVPPCLAAIERIFTVYRAISNPAGFTACARINDDNSSCAMGETILVDDSAREVTSIWSNDFTVDNVVDYARASRDLSTYIRLLAEDGYGQLVVPSRGAVPFIEAASTAWRMEMRGLTTCEERTAAEIQFLASPFRKKLELPFSADPQNTSQTTASIRRYWSKVLAAIVRRDGSDPYLTFYKAIVERLAKRDWLSNLPRDLPTEKFIFVDTVISGRAICEIFKAFECEGLDQCRFLLLVDANGSRIALQFARLIEEMVRAQRCTLIYVNRLFTEDRGPAVSGVWSTVYPQVLYEVQRKFAWAAAAYGAGSFYHQVSSSQVSLEKGIGDAEYNMPITRMYASLSIGIFSVLQATLESERLEAALAPQLAGSVQDFESVVRERRAAIDSRMRRYLEYHLLHLRNAIDEFGNFTPLDKRTTLALAKPRVLLAHRNAFVDISSSHLVRVTLPHEEIEHFMREAGKDLTARRDAFAYDWFR